jgi:hypothetical protein
MTSQVEERAQPPIRWPHPNRGTALTIALWALGLLVALLVPATIVPPTAQSATPAAAWTAFTFTVVGAALMIGATAYRWRKTQDAGILLLGAIPGASVIVGGIILATVKVLGFVT